MLTSGTPDVTSSDARTTYGRTGPRYDDVIDLERHPIHDRASIKYQAVVQGCRDQLRLTGLHRPPC